VPKYDAQYVPASAMTIFAHPDDVEFGVAGTLAAWSRAGCAVTMVLCTSGNVGAQEVSARPSEISEMRENEQRRAAEILGVRELVFLRHDDCQLQADLSLRRELVQAIRQHKPEVVICQDPTRRFWGGGYVNHPDHRAAAEAALDATFPCCQMPLLWPDLGPPHAVRAIYVQWAEESNVWIDITRTLAVKIDALRAHASQIGDWDPTPMLSAWSAAEAKEGRRRAKAWSKQRSARDDLLSLPPSVPPKKAKARHAESYRVMVLSREDTLAES
jgi:LmbE family N-acetylglucosaminyl deacetylase